MANVRSRIAALEAAAGVGRSRIVFLSRNAAGRMAGAGVDQAADEDDAMFFERVRGLLRQRWGRLRFEHLAGLPADEAPAGEGELEDPFGAEYVVPQP